MSDKHLLPPNRGRAEEALATGVAAQFPLPVPVAKLWSPDDCPAHLLPWLAWALSVESWSRDWPEEIKRDVIRQAIPIHRVKGSVGSVRRALGALGASVEIVEWWEDGGDPHTFRVDAWADDIFDAGFNVDNRLFEIFDRTLYRVKPARAHHTLRVGERFDTGTYLRAGMRPSFRHDLEADPEPAPHAVQTTVALRPGQRSIARSEVSHDPQPERRHTTVSMAIRAGARAQRISRITHDVLTQEAA